MFRLVLLALAREVLSRGSAHKQMFSYYAAKFKTVELNAPFFLADDSECTGLAKTGEQ